MKKKKQIKNNKETPPVTSVQCAEGGGKYK